MMNTNALLAAILQVEPLAYLDYRRTPDGVEWACYREGETAQRWYATCEESLAAYATELRNVGSDVAREAISANALLDAALKA